VTDDVDPTPSGIGRDRQAEIFEAGVFGRRPRVPLDWSELERRAARAMSRQGFGYVVGGAGLEDTMRANRAAFDRRRIVPRMLRDVSRRDIHVDLLGLRLPGPLLLCPVGVLALAHRDAEEGVARAAAAEGVPMIISGQASRPLEDIAAAMGDAPRWFQLYWSASDDLVASLVARAEASGAGAIVVTLDNNLLGWRGRDLAAAYLPFARGQGIAHYTSDPVFRAIVEDRARRRPRQPTPRPTLTAVRTLLQLTAAYPGRFLDNLRSPLPRAAVEAFLDVFSRPSLTWSDLPFLRDRTHLPILLKGILAPQDAARAVREGVDGIIVSNHGGRQVDGAIASLDALPGIVEAVDGAVPVLLDSGVRTGADVFKALALGAAAVCIGRPYVYGLAVAGSDGVREVIRNFLADFDLTMALAGCASIAQITREALAEAQPA
jgi:isopentenyl diphosphate isomerase/L-lactate dehydrogenase-like FMN-dependent dehydrogenase